MSADFVPRRPAAVGTRVVHRRYVDHGAAHYAGSLVSGGYVVGLFNDVATDLCISVDHDEGLFASYDEVTFRGPLLAGDVLEVAVEITAVGRRSRQLRFQAAVVARARPDVGETTSGLLSEPLIITTATGTVVVPKPFEESPDA